MEMRQEEVKQEEQAFVMQNEDEESQFPHSCGPLILAISAPHDIHPLVGSA